jgi:hypothetical protein
MSRRDRTYARPVASGNHTPAPLTATPTFELRRFAWATPDRLEVAGTFGGLQGAPPAAAPVLVVRAGDRVHRLPAIPDSLSGPPAEGRVWQAHFAWQDAPVAFDVAELQLGANLVVALPEPGAKRRLLRAQVLEVRTAQTREAAARRETLEIVRSPAKPAEATSVGSQVELLAAQEEVREVRVAMALTQAELTRAREDLKAERERRSGDGERFREGLAKVRESAEKALAVEQGATQRLGTELREAHEAIKAKDAALETLRKHVAKLETDAKETARLGAELARSRARADAARTELEQAYGSVDQARGEAERLLGRLTAIRAK